MCNFFKNFYCLRRENNVTCFIQLMSDHSWNIAVLFGHQFPLLTSTNLKAFKAFSQTKFMVVRFSPIISVCVNYLFTVFIIDV